MDEVNSFRFDWYNEKVNQYCFTRLTDALNQTVRLSSDIVLEPLDYYFLFEFSIFTPREHILPRIERIIDEHIAKLKANEENVTRVTHLSRSDDVILPQHIRDAIKNETSSINIQMREINNHIRKIKLFHEIIRNNPESSKQISFSILFITLLFFIGVIYPLSFLPRPENGTLNISLSIHAIIPTLFSYKGALLSLISILFSAVIIMFYKINMDMKYRKEDLEKLNAYTELINYSKYFKTMETNRRDNMHSTMINTIPE